MDRQAVTSSSIKSVGFAFDILEVEFLSGDVYQHLNVTRAKFDELLAAPSIGKFYHSHIRGKYPTAKVTAQS